MAWQKNDVLFAHIALNVAPGLTGAARQVGGAIVDHFNRETGQCAPGIDRLSVMLGLSRATVKRATAELCGDEAGHGGLFERAIHGGHAHRTAYRPRWDRLNAVTVDWNQRMKTGAAPSNGSELSPLKAQDCALDGLMGEPQTVRSNRMKKPFSDSSENAEAKKLAVKEPQRPAPLGNNDMRASRRQRSLLLTFQGGNTASRRDAAAGAEERRQAAKINALPDAKAREAAWLARMKASEG